MSATMTKRQRRTAIIAVLALACLPLAAAQSQLPPVPPEFYDGFRRVEGDKVTFCIDLRSPTVEFERAAAEAIAGALLLEPAFFEIDATYPIDAQGYFEDLFIWLTDECDAFMGFSLVAGSLPDWLTPTRPYVAFRYVVVARDPAVMTLSDLPLTEPISSQLVSAGDRALIAFLQARPADARWQRIPYADNALMLQRLQEGSLGAALIWEPTLLAL